MNKKEFWGTFPDWVGAICGVGFCCFMLYIINNGDEYRINKNLGVIEQKIESSIIEAPCENQKAPRDFTSYNWENNYLVY